ncbi:metalloendopeptidase OMA1, mitochondrial isoform X2 [Alosa sapidissima]|uniref:metalloendopeptidase OMA1, mitochondrial isoform X2 n=1 Tax=Alosa sapidissima TaxID=34773 RepID=UPI001C08FD70|nr:metalloendopeptidase OMA1, mitochondrial isoform X2 [Alosa sapidissima]
MELMCVRFVRQNFLRSLPTNSQAFILKSLRWYCVGRGELQKCCRPTPCLESVHGSRSIRVFGKKNKTCQPSRELTSPNQCLNARTSLNTFGSHRLKGNFNIVSTVTLRKQFFHTSGRLQALPAPLLWLVLKPIQKLLAIILGRSLRKWWIALSPNKQQLLRETAWRRRWHLAAGAAGLLVVMAIFLLTHLDESPVTGRTRLLVFSRENFLELANLTAEQHMEEFKDIIISPKDPRHQVVERVVQHLAERNQDIAEISTVPWSVHVVDSPTMNAFVLPNGKVFIFTGMLEAVADIHQLTFILGHEMAHALIGHSAEQASMSHVVDFLSLILLTAIWAVCPRDSLAALGHWIQGKLVQVRSIGPPLWKPGNSVSCLIGRTAGSWRRRRTRSDCSWLPRRVRTCGPGQCSGSRWRSRISCGASPPCPSGSPPTRPTGTGSTNWTASSLRLWS